MAPRRLTAGRTGQWLQSNVSAGSQAGTRTTWVFGGRSGIWVFGARRLYKGPEDLLPSHPALLAAELCAMADSTHMELGPETSVSRPSTPEIAPVGAGPVSPLTINGTECEPRPRQDCPPSVWISHISSTQSLLSLTLSKRVHDGYAEGSEPLPAGHGLQHSMLGPLLPQTPQPPLPMLGGRSAAEGHMRLGRPAPTSGCRLKAPRPNTAASLLPSPLAPPRLRSREEVYAELIHWYQW